MALRSRIVAISTACVLVIAGAACAVLVGGVVGEVLTIGLISLGLAGAVLLVFLEIGLGEERDLSKQQEPRATRERRRVLSTRRRVARSRWPRRPS